MELCAFVIPKVFPTMFTLRDGVFHLSPVTNFRGHIRQEARKRTWIKLQITYCAFKILNIIKINPCGLVDLPIGGIRWENASWCPDGRSFYLLKWTQMKRKSQLFGPVFVGCFLDNTGFISDRLLLDRICVFLTHVRSADREMSGPQRHACRYVCVYWYWHWLQLRDFMVWDHGDVTSEKWKKKKSIKIAIKSSCNII